MPVAAANATSPEPPGKEIPSGKRVWESAPVPTVSGSSMRFNQEWIMPSPGLSATPLRWVINCGSVSCSRTSTGFGYAEVWQKDCITRSAENVRHARSVSSSRVIPPVVSCEPTVEIFGSQYCPGRIPATPQALPTIFWASVKPAVEGAGAAGLRKTSEGASFSDSRAFAVRLRPIINGIRPPARTSSSSTSVLSVKVVTRRWLSVSRISPFQG